MRFSYDCAMTVSVCFFFLMRRRPPRSTLFPYTTLFRSRRRRRSRRSRPARAPRGRPRASPRAQRGGRRRRRRQRGRRAGRRARRAPRQPPPPRRSARPPPSRGRCRYVHPSSRTLPGQHPRPDGVACHPPAVLVALFGPTGMGKTAIALADALRADGEDPVAVSADALQLYAGLELLTGAATAEQRARLEHRLLGVLPIDGHATAGDFARRAHAEIDAL